MREETKGEDWTLINGDCVEEMDAMLESSVDLSVYSPPFLSLFTYSASPKDIGNCASAPEFFAHMAFAIQGLLKVTKPGRVTCCHIAQVAATLNNDGFIGMKDLRGSMVEAYVKEGWVCHGEIVIDKNPQVQAIRTHAKGLLFVQLKKDSSWLRPGMADYILLFRKPGDNAVPIIPDVSNEEWITFAHPVWYDIQETDVLNAAVARDNADERHICPLQLPVIRRCIRLWSNQGETVFSPFAGIGSEGYEALLTGRKYIGVELKSSYAVTAVKNLRSAELARKQTVLFA